MKHEVDIVHGGEEGEREVVEEAVDALRGMQDRQSSLHCEEQEENGHHLAQVLVLIAVGVDKPGAQAARVVRQQVKHAGEAHQ